MVAGVEGDLNNSFCKGLTSLCDPPGVQLPRGYEDLRSYIKGIAAFYACSVMTGPGQAVEDDMVGENIALHQSETRLQPCPSGKHALAALHR